MLWRGRKPCFHYLKKSHAEGRPQQAMATNASMTVLLVKKLGGREGNLIWQRLVQKKNVEPFTVFCTGLQKRKRFYTSWQTHPPGMPPWLNWQLAVPNQCMFIPGIKWVNHSYIAWSQSGETRPWHSILHNTRRTDPLFFQIAAYGAWKLTRKWRSQRSLRVCPVVRIHQFFLRSLIEMQLSSWPNGDATNRCKGKLSTN